MQAALQDTAQNKPNSRSFEICQRVLHKCHDLIFADLQASRSSPYSSVNLPFRQRVTKKKVKTHFEPCLVGIGMIVAAVASNTNANVLGQTAVEQGYAPDEGEHERPDLADDDSIEERVNNIAVNELGNSNTDTLSFNNPSENLDERWRVQGAQTTPILPLKARIGRDLNLTLDPFGQLEHIATNLAPYQSSPTVSSVISPPLQRASSNLSQSDILLQKYDVNAQMQLLRKQFCRSEVRDNLFARWKFADRK